MVDVRLKNVCEYELSQNAWGFATTSGLNLARDLGHICICISLLSLLKLSNYNTNKADNS